VLFQLIGNETSMEAFEHAFNNIGELLRKQIIHKFSIQLFDFRTQV